MKKQTQPRFEAKISYWLDAHADYTLECIEDYQEKLHSLIRCNVESICDDERQLIVDMLNELLSLSFILQNHKEDAEKFYEYYN